MSIFKCCEPTCTPGCDDSDCCEGIQVNIVAPSGELTIVDTLDLTKYDAVQWNALVIDPSQNKRRFQAIYATHELNTTPFHNEFSHVGSRKQDFDYTFDVDINLGLFRLKIQNDSPVDYILEVVRIPVEIYVPTP